MEETEERKGRDEWGIRYMVDNTTEDVKMEQFLMAIPGSFSTDSGAKVWEKVGNTMEDESEDRSQNEPALGHWDHAWIQLVTTVPTTQAIQLVVRRRPLGS